MQFLQIIKKKTKLIKKKKKKKMKKTTKYPTGLTGVAQWIEHHSANKKSTSSILSQGTQPPSPATLSPGSP